MDNPNSSLLNNSTLKVGIIGLGAIGCLISSQIPTNTQVYALPSNPNLNRIKFQLEANKQSRQYSFNVWQGQSLDVIIICCKATQCLSALELWQSAIGKSSQIVLLQNGMGQHEQVASLFPNNVIYAASTTEGAYKKSGADNSVQHIIHAGHGITQWGHYGPEHRATEALKLDLSSLQGEHKWHDNIIDVLFAKLAINAVINALTVKYNCPNGDLIYNPVIAQELENLCFETESFFMAMKWPLDFKLIDKAQFIAELTAKNISSMLQDVRALRKTEIDFINGYLLNKAKTINYPLPKNQQLFDEIKSR
ncbi:MAG: 2-dehydropantoate 2-reductase [Oleispira sp.]